MLPRRINSKLPEIFKGYVEGLRKIIDNPKSVRADVVKLQAEYVAKIKKETGLSISLSLVNNLNAGMSTAFFTHGHSGTRKVTYPEIKHASDRYITKENQTGFKVDLTRMRFSGPLTEEHLCDIEVGIHFFNRRFGFTDEMITAFLLHEFGHLASLYINFGDYVLLNHYIATAMDVFQGIEHKEKNVEIYSEEWIRQNVPESQLNDFIYGATDKKTALKVALVAARSVPRTHITGSDFTASTREEQFADLFVARIGYGRQMAQANHLFDRVFGSEYLYPTNGFVRFVKFTASFTIWLPITAALFVASCFEGTPEDQLFAGQYRYDSDKERILKIRRELIFQTKTATDAKEREQLLSDIKVIDDLMGAYNKVDKTVYETLRYVSNYKWRKHSQQQEKEQQLEQLVNNDIFIKSFKIA